MKPRPLPVRLAPALVTLREQVNRLFPVRPKDLDGWIGDKAHQSRKSDHNPNEHGIVTAIDITDGMSSAIAGPIAAYLANAIIRNRDRRLKYLIYDRKIWAGNQGPDAWKPRPYRGANPHSALLHVSVLGAPSLANDDSLWML